MKNIREKLLPVTLMAVGAVGMISGAYRGELKILFTKAINICLECVGIG